MNFYFNSLNLYNFHFRINSIKFLKFFVLIFFMGILNLFKKKKKEVKAQPKFETEREPSLLEQLCKDDKALYDDLSWSLYLDPRGKGSYKEAIKKAEKLEKKGKIFDARIAYHHAGSLALYESNIEGIKRAFSKVAELGGRKYERLMEVPEKAIEVAQEFYKRELKSEEVSKE